MRGATRPAPAGARALPRLAGALALVALVALVALGCATVGGGPTRTATFKVDEAARSFTLTIDEPGRATLRIAGDARGSAIPEAHRRALLAYLDAHIERLEGVPDAAPELRWLRLFREAYGR